ncbi:ABC transporter ATP-binding protein [Microvirga soli]|uniref:ABC transporter ATP-binding protein n=1 Tax=Microvirga soli TaxID=1854496 RepID=UPI00191DD708|nr:ABC transporter ATP-binding protein [Microvirga soli]
MANPLLTVSNLSVEYPTRHGWLRAVNDVSLELAPGMALGVVGESGSGKSTLGQALMGLTGASQARVGGRITFDGQDITGLTNKAWRRIRGDRIAMVFQDPTSTLNPVLRIGDQIAEVFQWHRPDMPQTEVRRRTLGMLERVGIREAERRLRSYPHELSGGMRQRVVIACALALEPALLIADEPTTALDVTVQAQILDLMRDLIIERGTAMILISHDLDVIGDTCDAVAVMYAGRVVEFGATDDVLAAPQHPYTKGLLASRPRFGHNQAVAPIAGTVPDLRSIGTACAFQPRCAQAVDLCGREGPPLQGFVATDSAKVPHRVACHVVHQEPRS